MLIYIQERDKKIYVDEQGKHAYNDLNVGPEGQTVTGLQFLIMGRTSPMGLPEDQSHTRLLLAYWVHFSPRFFFLI